MILGDFPSITATAELVVPEVTILDPDHDHFGFFMFSFVLTRIRTKINTNDMTLHLLFSSLRRVPSPESSTGNSEGR